MAKQIEELLIQVKYKGIKPATTQMEKLSEAVNDAAMFTDDLNASLGRVSVPKSVQALTSAFSGVSQSLKNIDINTRSTADVMAEVLDQLGNNADAANQDVRAIVQTLEDLESGSISSERAIDKLSNSFKGLGTQTDQNTKKQKKYHNGLKDVNRQGANGVRTFSKMASSAGGVAAAYAVIAANIFAVTEAFRLLSEAASVARLEDISNTISANLGVSIQGTAQALLDATDNAISYQEALKQAAAATAFGFDTATISEFATVARRASVVLGVDMTDALNRVVKGVSKAEVELLDELGITVRLNEAFAKYAAQHNLAADSLNAFQRQQALANEVILKSAQNLGAADEALRATSWEQFGANVSSATNEMLRFVAESEGLTTLLSDINNWFKKWNQESRAAAATTASIDTVTQTKDRASRIMAINNLMTEQRKLTEDLAEANALADVQRAKGARAATSIFDTTEEIAARNELKATLAEIAGIRNELELTDKAIKGFTTEIGLTPEQVTKLAGAVGNLQATSRTLSAELTSFNSDLRGDANPYSSLSDSVTKAAKSVKELTDANVSLEVALSKGKISQAQFEQFKDVQAYAKAIDDAAEARRDIALASSATLGTESRAAKLAVVNSKLLNEQFNIAKKRELSLQAQASWTEKLRNATAKVVTTSLAEAASITKLAILRAEQLTSENARNTQAQRNLDVAKATMEATKNELAASRGLVLTEAQRANLAAKDQVARIKWSEALATREAEIVAEKQKQAQLFSPESTLSVANTQIAAAEEVLARLKEQGAELAVIAEHERSIAAARRERAAQLASSNFAVGQDALASLSPEFANVSDQLFALSDAWKVVGDSAATSAERMQASMNMAGSALSGIGSLIQAASKAATSAIDVQIAQVKLQGGTEEEQAAKIKELNKKKIKEQEKAAKASILINTATGVMMAFGTLPFPLNIAQAAVVTAAGALAYEQASNSATAQLAGLESAATSSASSLTLGSTDAGSSVDVGQSATAAERSQSLGDRGVFGRASGGKAYAGNSYIAGETGPEMITPTVDSSVATSSETAQMLSGAGRGREISLHINALDASSIVDRAADILTALEEEANQRGSTLLSD